MLLSRSHPPGSDLFYWSQSRNKKAWVHIKNLCNTEFLNESATCNLNFHFICLISCPVYISVHSSYLGIVFYVWWKQYIHDVSWCFYRRLWRVYTNTDSIMQLIWVRCRVTLLEPYSISHKGYSGSDGTMVGDKYTRLAPLAGSLLLCPYSCHAVKSERWFILRRRIRQYLHMPRAFS